MNADGPGAEKPGYEKPEVTPLGGEGPLADEDLSGVAGGGRRATPASTRARASSPSDGRRSRR